MTAWCSGILARLLTATCPARARDFGFWYREQCVRHPRWVQPIAWEPLVRLPDGPLMKAPFREVQGMSLILRKSWEPRVTSRVLGSIRRGGVFVDVGANLGYYTLLASEAVGPEGMVLAFEPSPANLRHLIGNLELNGCTNVVLYSEALSCGPGLARLSRAPQFNCGVCSLRDGGVGDYTMTSTRRFDDIVRPLGIGDRIGLVKIDTEGTELQVLRGMEQTLAANPSLEVVCEISPEWSPVGELLGFMESLGFRGEVLDGGEWRPLRDDSLPVVQSDAWFSRC